MPEKAYRDANNTTISDLRTAISSGEVDADTFKAAGFITWSADVYSNVFTELVRHGRLQSLKTLCDLDNFRAITVSGKERIAKIASSTRDTTVEMLTLLRNRIGVIFKNRHAVDALNNKNIEALKWLYIHGDRVTLESCDADNALHSGWLPGLQYICATGRVKPRVNNIVSMYAGLSDSEERDDIIECIRWLIESGTVVVTRAAYETLKSTTFRKEFLSLIPEGYFEAQSAALPAQTPVLERTDATPIENNCSCE
ncbi:unnamed protein product [Sphagnum balticum]